MVRRSKLVSYGLPLAALAAALAAAMSIARNQPAKTTLSPVVSPPAPPAGSAPSLAKGFIGAAGLIEPADEQIDIGAHVSGIVAAVHVRAGHIVAKGEPLFEIDARSAAAQLAIRKAELAAAERRLDLTLARIATLKAQLVASKAAADAARAEFEDMIDQVRTADQLKTKSDLAITSREVTRRHNAERAARSKLEEARARITQAEAELDLVARPEGAPSVEVERANIEQAREAVRRAEVDLALLNVRAPITASVLQVNVRPGEFAQAGALTTPHVVLGVLDPLHVRVDIDEVDIGRFKPAAKAWASLRGQAEKRAELTFVRVEPLVVPKRALTGIATERVDTRVLRVLYALPASALSAYPGQQVDVFIADPSATD